MATSGPTQLPAFLDGDATFRQWAQGIHNALVAVGMVQTADTGQINLATAARPGALNTAAGYEIFRFSDALQATAPVFIKIEYGVGGALDRPSIAVTVGTGTNGAGTLSGAGVRTRVGPSASKTAGTNLPLRASGSSRRLALVYNYDSGSASFAGLIVVERLRDAADNPVAAGVLVNLDSPGSISTQIISTSGVGSNITVVGFPFFFVLGRWGAYTASGADVAVLGAHVPHNGLWYRVLGCLVNSSDFADETAFSVTNMGQTHTLMGFLRLGNAPTNSRVAIPWE